MMLLVSLFSGILFGAGLVLAGMTNPAKVSNFLDVAGSWDPSLAFVMGAALLVTVPGYRLIMKREAPVYGERFFLPERVQIDKPLVMGAIVFGLGWGLVGLCPAPAIVGVLSLQTESGIFLAAMLAGIVLYRLAPPPKSLMS